MRALVVFLAAVLAGAPTPTLCRASLWRADADRLKYKIPDGFLLGVGTGSYQTEGAWNEDGKGENVYDYAYHKANATNGDVAADSYHRYAEDIALAAEMKLNTYRFSISWARIFPDGSLSSKNQKGIDHYHRVIAEIKKHNMVPMVTIYHFDHPQTLEAFGGWLSEKMIDIFVDFSDFIFSEYGKEVQYWVTINEPNMHCLMAYAGMMPPHMDNVADAASIYKCIHNEILAHSKVYVMYKAKYQATQKGKLGIGAVTFFSRPNSTEFQDIETATRANMFDVGLLLHPLVFGDYHPVVRGTLEAVGKLFLPEFTEEEKKTLPGTFDFLALNGYFGSVVAAPQASAPVSVSSSHSAGPSATVGLPKAGGLPQVGPRVDANVTVCSGSYVTLDTESNVFSKVMPWVLREATLWVRAHFGPKVPIFITENGLGMPEDSIDDWNTRAFYSSAYLRDLMRTINEDGVNVIGYTVWSAIDTFEFRAGYFQRRFGLIHIDYENGSLNRTLKRSSAFFKQMMTQGYVPLVEGPAGSSSTATRTTTSLFLLAFVAGLSFSKFFTKSM